MHGVSKFCSFYSCHVGIGLPWSLALANLNWTYYDESWRKKSLASPIEAGWITQLDEVQSNVRRYIHIVSVLRANSAAIQEQQEWIDGGRPKRTQKMFCVVKTNVRDGEDSCSRVSAFAVVFFSSHP
ncbi:hypothetical protein DITRI_Ditri11bG0087700 [Diplodiscus trichospermus]